MPTSWPRGGKPVYVHVLTTGVGTLYRCQVVIVQLHSPGPGSGLPGCWKPRRRHRLIIPWPVGTSRSSSPIGKKSLAGAHQLVSAHALVCFWTLAMLASVFAEQEHQRLRAADARTGSPEDCSSP